MRERAATALRITAPELLELRVIDEIIPEPLGGAHANHEATAQARAGRARPHSSRSCGASSRTSSCAGAGRSFCAWASSRSSRRGQAFALQRHLALALMLAVLLRWHVASHRSRVQGQPKGVLPLGGDDPPPLKAPVIVDADRGEDLGRVHAIGELRREAQRADAARLRRRGARTQGAARSPRREDVRRRNELRDAGRRRAPQAPWSA